MKLSEHFSLWEFTTSQTAARKGIDNTPTQDVINNLTILCTQILEPARLALGPLRISSGYRSPRLNKAIGGSKSSAHCLGWAADVIPLQATNLMLAQWITKNCEFDQVILEYGSKSSPSWIHVSADPRSRKQVMQILAGTGYQEIKL